MRAAILKRARGTCGRAVLELDAAARDADATDPALALKLRMISGMVGRYAAQIEPAPAPKPNAFAGFTAETWGRA